MTKSKIVKLPEAFPVPHFSPSSMKLLSTNAILFKIKYINRDIIDTTTGASAVLGKAFHKAMEVYYGGSDTLIPGNESEAIDYGLKAGMDFIDKYEEGWIRWTENIPNKTKLFELLSFTFNEYVKERKYQPNTIVAIEEEIKEAIDVEWKGQRLVLPVKLKGRLDKISNEEEKLKLTDYKTCHAFSKPEKIDGAKIIQAIVYYLLAYVRFGKAPYSMTFDEVKYSKNKNGRSQVQSYEIVYAENDLFFNFFFRFYEDAIRALNGEMVYLPNLDANYDNEVAIVAYINRLDVDEETARLMKKHHVETLTELLKKQIQSSANMRKLMKSVEKDFVSVKNIDYSKMQNHEKIQRKLLEHGMMLSFDSKIEGSTVDLYRYTPSMGLKMARLEAYTADVEQALGITGLRVLAPIPGTSLIGFEVPRKHRTFPGIAPAAKALTVAMGIDINGETQYVDLKTAPHLLVAGTPGSGKSVLLRSMLGAIGGSARLWLMDPKMVELAGIPNERYADEIIDIMKMLKDLTIEMDARYKKMRTGGLKDWSGKRIIAVIDEFADLVLQSKEGFEEWELCERHQAYNDATQGGVKRILTTKRRLRVKEEDIKESIERCSHCKKHIFPPASDSVLRIAQKGRAAGIHMILATQSPRTDIITGLIKANFPTRVALRTASKVDSEVIMDKAGAEKLLGKGDHLLMRSDSSEIIRLQGFNI